MVVSFGEIEHILPKSIFPELVVAWANLTLACSRCNGAKGDKYTPDLLFVNPYVDEIHEHLIFMGPVVVGASGRGDYTIKELDLNGVHRIEARNRAIRELEMLLRLSDASLGTERLIYRELAAQHVETGEYTASLKTYMRNRKLPA